jgi:hypothetical protein
VSHASVTPGVAPLHATRRPIAQAFPGRRRELVGHYVHHIRGSLSVASTLLCSNVCSRPENVTKQTRCERSQRVPSASRLMLGALFDEAWSGPGTYYCLPALVQPFILLPNADRLRSRQRACLSPTLRSSWVGQAVSKRVHPAPSRCSFPCTVCSSSGSVI